MKLINTGDPQFKPSVVMLVYGEGGVGKTTFASTAPKPLLVDCEGGTKYLGLRNIKIPVAMIERWGDMEEVLKLAKTDEYETIIIDPVGELMDKLKVYLASKNDSKLVQKDGSPSMAGWGWLKKTLRDYIKVLRGLDKHVILIAHVEEKEDEGRLVKRPKIETKISDDLINMVDIVGYMTSVEKDGEDIRIIRVEPTSDKFVAKDRTGQLGKVIPPRFNEIVEAIHGTKTYKWMKSAEVKDVSVEPKEDKTEKEAVKPEKKEVPDEVKEKRIDRMNCLKALGYSFNKKEFILGEKIIALSEISDDSDEEFAKKVALDGEQEKNKEITDALELDPEDMPVEKKRDEVITAGNDDDELEKKLAEAKG